MIIQEIKTAFGDMPYPGTERIVNDLQGYDLERKQIKEEFSRYENWLDVPPWCSCRTGCVTFI